MYKDNRDLLEVLKHELEFVERGGYQHAKRATWRPQFMFQDSPSCLNYEVSQHTKPCTECELMQLVPLDAQQHNIPCRHIPLDDEGTTLDSLYRTGTQSEIESTFKQWLKTRIAQLEQERAESLRTAEHPEIHVHGKFLT